MVRDTRLAQTAVIGDEHSDVPVVLPQEAIELDQFRSIHEHDTYWCGLLLGGCGKRVDDVGDVAVAAGARPGARFTVPPPIGSLVDADLRDGSSLRGTWTPQHRPTGRTGEPPYWDRALCSNRACWRAARTCTGYGATATEPSRRVWIGTQSVARATDWVPLSECAWTSDGLFTPSAARILRERPVLGPESPVRHQARQPAPLKCRRVSPR